MQSIYNIAEILAQKGVKHVILSPGSRCAPLTIAFVRHPKIDTKTISDERSAAFIALGLAQSLNEPVALLCTSGTAALNYAPAIAEAFYRNIPLIVITADRPTEWIDQLDGQTIRQQNIFNNHIKKSYHISADQEHSDHDWLINRSFNEAINLSNSDNKGPVHVNLALREPLYPKSEIKFDQNIRIIHKAKAQNSLTEETWVELAKEVSNYKTILILVGQQNKDVEFNQILNSIQTEYDLVVVGDIISNVFTLKNSIKHHDIYLHQEDLSNLKPDLIISFGLSLISKKLKQFIRKNKPKAHWHIQNSEIIADTFQSLTRHLTVDNKHFIENFNQLLFTKNTTQTSYLNEWQQVESKAKEHLNAFFENNNFGEFEAIYRVINQLENNTVLHLSNSMTVRYANIISTDKQIEIMANRGTSGIDGSTSTAFGCSLANNKTHVLITGDMAFFYDRNALWNKYIKENFKIVILNNHAGGIFRIIDGPKSQPELEEYFETEQALNAQKTAEDHNLKYYSASTTEEFISSLPFFLANTTKGSIFEIFTDSKTNEEIFSKFKI